jgi:hypothetical protein
MEELRRRLGAEGGAGDGAAHEAALSKKELERFEEKLKTGRQL